MFFPITFLSAVQIVVNDILHFYHFVIDNKKLNNITIDYWHDETGNVRTNMTVEKFLVTTKMTVYVKVNIAKDIHDDLFKKEVLRTQIDFNKLYKGLYGNILIKGFTENIIKDIKEQNFTIPIKQVRKFPLLK